MKRDFILTTSGKAASALSCVALSLLACVQAGAQVAPPQAQGPSGVRVEGAGGGVQGVRSGAPTDWVLQLKSGQISPEEAWNRGLLTASNAGRVIWSQEIAAKEYKDLRLKLAGLLAERAPEVLGPRNGADRELKRVAGDYFRSQKDERAVGFLEAALEELLQERQAQMKSRTAGDVARKGDPKWITPLANLAMFYSETGRPLQAAQTWERSQSYSTNPAWLADASIEAARSYSQGGKQEKAQQLYAQAGRSSVASYAGGAIIEGFGRELQRNPKQTELQLLQLEKEVTTPNARLATHFLLAWARYKAQDWKGFLLRAEQVLKDYEQIEDKSRRQALAPLALNLEEAQRWARLWPTRSVVAENPALHLMFDGPLLQPIERRIFVNTPTLTQLQVTVEGDKERVQARLEDSPWAPELQDTRYQRIVVVTITPGVPQVQAKIQISQVGQPSQVEPISVVVSSQVKEGTRSN